MDISGWPAGLFPAQGHEDSYISSQGDDSWPVSYLPVVSFLWKPQEGVVFNAGVPGCPALSHFEWR